MDGNLLDILRQQKAQGGNLYHKTQIALAYNSLRLDGNKLTEAQTRDIYDIKQLNGHAFVYDIYETCNHFQAFDYLLENAELPLTQVTIKKFHELLKANTHTWPIGEYKTAENRSGKRAATPPFDVEKAMTKLLATYHQTPIKTLDDLVEFHWQFDQILPFQDSNGPLIRLIMFKECLKYNIMPFIIFDNYEVYHDYLPEPLTEKEFLRETYLLAQDIYAIWFERFC